MTWEWLEGVCCIPYFGESDCKWFLEHIFCDLAPGSSEAATVENVDDG